MVVKDQGFGRSNVETEVKAGVGVLPLQCKKARRRGQVHDSFADLHVDVRYITTV